MIDPDDVMAGPRGRRLCLELAAGLARATGTPEGDEYLRAAFLCAYHLDPGAGTSRMMVLVSDGGPDDDAEPISTPADVARRLDGLPLDRLGPGVLLAALQAAVDNARYWQEPDGEDVLAATAEVRASLSRVAAAVVSSSPAAWWVTPLERTTQASVVFDDPAARTTPALTAEQTLRRWHDGTLEEEARAQRERPADPRAPFSGTWWSTPPHGLTRTTRQLGDAGPVGLGLVEDAFSWERASVRAISVPAEARVYEVDGVQAWSDLCRRFPLDVTASRRHDWFRTTGVAGRWVIPDWARVADRYDAVHLTTAGYLATAGRAVAVDGDARSVLANWNPDEAYWLTDPPPATEAGRRWRRVDDRWQEDPR
ncbi:VWA domain-containing protein [Cellulomonas fengjieae]|uniref:VWA domain-containing protein n=1 Tax=Cellulomonas fengjieae TaxID=2819978 RepID=UPI001AAE6A4F|nr:VWA domain-containing protein [Cellulomonas fengjieae]MBO3101192.1 VWA domain-containing protein [Cellulomonas fengjieae]